MVQDCTARLEIREPLTERSNRWVSEPTTLHTDVYVWRYALLAVHTRKEDIGVKTPNSCGTHRVQAESGDMVFRAVRHLFTSIFHPQSIVDTWTKKCV